MIPPPLKLTHFTTFSQVSVFLSAHDGVISMLRLCYWRDRSSRSPPVTGTLHFHSSSFPSVTMSSSLNLNVFLVTNCSQRLGRRPPSDDRSRFFRNDSKMPSRVSELIFYCFPPPSCFDTSPPPIKPLDCSPHLYVTVVKFSQLLYVFPKKIVSSFLFPPPSARGRTFEVASPDFVIESSNEDFAPSNPGVNSRSPQTFYTSERSPPNFFHPVSKVTHTGTF